MEDARVATYDKSAALKLLDKVPDGQAVSERLNAMERTAGERLEEIEWLSDALLARELEDEEPTLWPLRPEQAPAFRHWLSRASGLLPRGARRRLSSASSTGSRQFGCAPA